MLWDPWASVAASVPSCVSPRNPRLGRSLLKALTVTLGNGGPLGCSTLSFMSIELPLSSPSVSRLCYLPPLTSSAIGEPFIMISRLSSFYRQEKPSPQILTPATFTTVGLEPAGARAIEMDRGIRLLTCQLGRSL